MRPLASGDMRGGPDGGSRTSTGLSSPTPSLLRRLLARPEAALFALVLAPYVFFYQAGGWNQNSRFDLVRAIVEQQSFEIDSFTCSNPHAPNVPSHLNTGDVSCRGPNGRCQVASALGDRTYCDKAPGVSFLAVPVYAAVYLVAGGGPGPPSPRYLAGASHLVTIWSAGIPAAIAVAMIFLLLGTLGVGRPTQLAVSLAYGLGTITFPYATLLYGNSLAAALLVIAFALLVRARRGDTATGPARLIGIGLILSFSIVVEYSAVLGVVPLLVYAGWFVRPLPRLGWLVLGMAPPGLLLAGYDWVAFGGPFTLSYEYSVFSYRQQAFFGLGMPSWEALSGITFSAFRGLFFSAPWLLLAVPGAAWWARRHGVRSEMGVCAAVALLFFWLNASLVDWQGGWGMGPRFLMPAIPFMAIAVAGLASVSVEAPRPRPRIVGWAVYAGAVGYSTFMMLVGTAVKPEVPQTVLRPFSEFLLPLFYTGELAVNTQSIDAGEALMGERHAYNLGHAMGLDGLASLAPLLVPMTAAGVWLWWSFRAQTSGEGGE